MNQVDYNKLDYQAQSHYIRFKKHVEKHGLLCQECGGSGEVVVDRIDWWDIKESCGWCMGTGKITRWLRGQWLKYKRMDKLSAKKALAS